MLFLISLTGEAQTGAPAQDSPFLNLAFKLLIRSPKPFYAQGEDVKIDVACVSVVGMASPTWQARWDHACAGAKLEVDEARVGGYWGQVFNITPRLANRVMSCSSPDGSYEYPGGGTVYSSPVWHSIRVPVESFAGKAGLLEINATVELKHESHSIAQEHADLTVAVLPGGDERANIPSNSPILGDAAEVQAGNSDKVVQLADDALALSTETSLRIAARVFDNTPRTKPLLQVLLNSPYPKLAVEQLESRLVAEDVTPDLNLIMEITALKARLNHPLEFDSEDRQPYTEYHEDMEDAALVYFRSLIKSLVDSHKEGSVRVGAVSDLVEEAARPDICPMGTYGVSFREAATFKAKLLSH